VAGHAKEHMKKIVEKREKFLEQRKEVHERQGMEALSYDELLEACRGIKGGGKGSGSAARRFPLSDDKVTGTVKLFRDYCSSSYGLIKPGKAINHPKAARRDGDVWFSIKDVVGVSLDYAQPEWLSPGCEVSFTLFADNAGLGAEEVSQM